VEVGVVEGECEGKGEVGGEGRVGVGSGGEVRVRVEVG